MAVVASFSMSLDGFIADPEDRVGPLFDWLFNGTVEITPPGYPITYKMSPASARYWTETTDGFDQGSIVCGRRTFDHTSGWGGRPPGFEHAFVVTHQPPPPDWPPFPDAPFMFRGVTLTRFPVSPGSLSARHLSFEHRFLGDMRTSDVTAVWGTPPQRTEVIERQLRLLDKWSNNPYVKPEVINDICPWIRTVELGPAQVVATYGVPQSTLRHILQSIRQESYNQLFRVLHGHNPAKPFVWRSAASTTPSSSTPWSSR
jgi:hypothetical protein